VTNEAPAARRVPRWRRITAHVLLFVGCGLVPLTVLSIWLRNQVLSTDRYVATVGPLADDPHVQEAAADRITTALMGVADITDRAKDVLPPRAAALAPAFESAVEGFVHDQALKVVQSEQFAKFWREANRFAHDQVRSLLTGDTKIVKVEDGKISIDLQPMLIAVRQKLVDSGLTIVENVPVERVNARFDIFASKDLDTAQSAVDLLQKLAVVFPILVIGSFAGAIALAGKRRSMVMWIGLGMATAAALLSVGIAVGRAAYLSGLSGVIINKPAAEAVYDTTVRNILLADRIIIVVGLLISLIAYLSGSSPSAVRLRAAATGSATKMARATGAHAGPVSRWFAAHVVALRVVPVVLAVVALAFWDHPRPRTLVFLVIAVILAMLVIEGIARAGREPEPAEPASPEPVA
jgi:hypothetical protein